MLTSFFFLGGRERISRNASLLEVTGSLEELPYALPSCEEKKKKRNI